MSDALVNGLSGACGGMIAQVLTYPLQAVNTRQQVRRKLLRSNEDEGEVPSPTGAVALPGRRGESDADAPGGSEPALSGVSAAQDAGTDRQEGHGIAEGSRRETRMADSSAGGRPAGQAGPLQGSKSSSGAGMSDTAREMWQIVRNEGVGALYRGLEPSLFGTACSQGVYYYFYQLFRDRAERYALRRKEKGLANGQVTMVESLIVAAMAGCVNVLLTNPIWVIVTRIQTQSAGISSAVVLKLQGPSSSEPQTASMARSVSLPPKSPRNLGAFATTWELFEEAGILGFWKGVLPTMIMVSNPAIQFTIYETLLARLTVNRPQARGGAKSASAWEIFLIGALAKLGATVVTYPLLVVKARLQARSTDSKSQYSGTLDALARIVLEEGLRGLYKGIETKIVQSVFAASVLFLTKEELVKFVRSLVERNERRRARGSLPAKLATS